MARKKSKPLEAEFVMFDVVYVDGSRRSNRRVPTELLGGLDGDEPAATPSWSRTASSPRNPACRRLRSPA